jgi:hypothetical protein
MKFFIGSTSNASTTRIKKTRFRESSVLVVLAVSATIALSACGGPDSSTIDNVGTSTVTTVAATGSGTNSSNSLAFARCLRSNGVPNFPDPNSSGVIQKESPQQLGVSVSTYRTALSACSHLLPNGGNGPNQAQLQQVRALGLRFAQCMRRHGVALPDPASDGRIPDPGSVGIDQGSPRFQAANQACGKYRPPYMPSNAAYNAYAQSQ